MSPCSTCQPSLALRGCFHLAPEISISLCACRLGEQDTVITVSGERETVYLGTHLYQECPATVVPNISFSVSYFLFVYL